MGYYGKIREQTQRKLSAPAPAELPPCGLCGYPATTEIEGVLYCARCDPLRIIKHGPTEASSAAVARLAELRARLLGKG